MPTPLKCKHLPHYKELLIPTLKALIALGGSGCNAEINRQVYTLACISEEDSSIPHVGGKVAISEIDFQLSWARSYLKYYGLINNSTRGIWTLNDASINPDNYIPDDIIKHVNQLNKQQTAIPTVSSTDWQHRHYSTASTACHLMHSSDLLNVSCVRAASPMSRSQAKAAMVALMVEAS